MSLIYLSCAWVAGIFLGSRLGLPVAFIFIGLIPLPLLFFVHQHKKLIFLTSACLVLLLGGTIQFKASLPISNENHLQFYNNQGMVEIKGQVAGDPEVGDRNTNLYLSSREIKLDEAWHPLSGNALLYVPRYPGYRYGDVLLITGRLETPPALADFDYKGYLAHQGTYSIMSYPQIEVIERGKGFKPLGWIYSLRDHLSRTLAEILPEPQAALAQGILLGIRGNIPSSINNDFTLTGTAHILAISGMNLTILAGILVSLGIWLFGRRHYIYVWLSLTITWLYALLTGMQPPVLRATIMASLFLTAELLGRQRSTAIALVFAAAVMVGISPQILWDAAFQMSFMAMAGLVFILPLLQSPCRKAVIAAFGENGVMVPAANFITDGLCVSLAAIVAVWPLIVYYFGIIAPVGPVATFFALPALSGIIVTGALAGLLGLIWLPLGKIIAWLAWLFLSYLLLVVRASARVPSIEGGSINPILVLIYYSMVALVIWLVHWRERFFNLMTGLSSLVSRLPKKWVISPLLAAAVLVSLAAITMPDNKLHVSFLDVGEGDAILIRQGSEQILVDGGPSPQAICLALGKEMPFWDRTIELVVLTHPHADHVAGLVEVLNRYKVKQVLYPDLEYQSPVYNEWLNLIKQKDIKYTLAQAGQQINLGTGAVIEVLNPQPDYITGTVSDIDNNSVVLRVKMSNVSFLLTADIMREAEFALITRRASLASTILKVAHHGSDTSSTPEFLAVVNPRMTIISVGKDNPFGLPSEEVVARLEQEPGKENVFRTDEHGIIEFITDGKKLSVNLEREKN